MGRYPRPYLPGAAFHITARIQHQEHRLAPPGLRDRVVRLLQRQVHGSDVCLLAYVIMTNHLHLVLVQGGAPLGRFMQPLLRSAALAVQMRHGTEGHVFERRFRDRICRDPVHLRNAIAYTHANPVRAGMCRNPEDYPWSSHRFYVTDAPATGRFPTVDSTRGLAAFAPDAVNGKVTSRSAYTDYLAGVLRPADDAVPESADGAEGDDPVSNDLRGAATGPLSDRPALEVVARQALAGAGAPFGLPELKARWGPRSRQPLRARFALHAAGAGYTGAEISRFLELSEPTVSRLLARARTEAAASG